jgi:hypothetical protein
VAVRYAQPAADLVAAAEQALTAGLRDRSFRVSSLRDMRPGDVRLAEARPVGSVSVQDILGRVELSEVAIKVWQFAVTTVAEQPEPAATLEMLPGGPSAEPRMLSLSSGPFTRSAAAAVARAEALDDDGGDAFEVRLLQISALYVVVLWLHHEIRPARLMVLEPAPPGVETDRVYSWPELLDTLGRLARARSAAI